MSFGNGAILNRSSNMSTRALYTFIGDKKQGSPHSFNVYKHHDGYPSGAARTIKMGIDWFAWKLPRYESDAFACAFIAAGKFGPWLETKEDLIEWFENYGPTSDNKKFSSNGGGCRLMPSGNPTKVAGKNCSDIAYRYEISMVNETLTIKAFEGSWWEEPKETCIFSGTFDDFYNWALAKDKAA
jgi:hypothetical protein